MALGLALGAHNGKGRDTGPKLELAHTGWVQVMEEFLALGKVDRGAWCFLGQPEHRSYALLPLFLREASWRSRAFATGFMKARINKRRKAGWSDTSIL